MKTNKFSLWQLLKSYLYPVKIEEKQSAVNGNLSLVLSNGILQLETHKSIYSQGVKYKSFNRAFRYIKAENLNLNKVLVLGGGLCSIPQILNDKYQQKASYTIIEMDELVIEMANQYLTKDLLGKCDYINKNAFDVIVDLEHFYDMICIDLYVDDKVPKQAMSFDFVNNLSQKLTNKGHLIFSVMQSEVLSELEIETYYKNIFQQCFPTAQLLTTNGNVILMNR